MQACPVTVFPQQLKWETEGTSRISIDPSEPDGLGITGDLVVLWNGSEVYAGPARKLTLEAPTPSH